MVAKDTRFLADDSCHTSRIDADIHQLRVRALWKTLELVLDYVQSSATDHLAYLAQAKRILQNLFVLYSGASTFYLRHTTESAARLAASANHGHTGGKMLIQLY